MRVIYNTDFKANLRIDDKKIVHSIMHPEGYAVSGLQGREAAVAYVGKVASVLGIPESALNELDQKVSFFNPRELKETLQVKLRFNDEQSIMDSSTITFYQTYLNTPVWEAGVSITLRGPNQVIAASNTCVFGINAKLPSPKMIQRYLELFTVAKNPDDELLKGNFGKATENDVASIFKMLSLDSSAVLNSGRFFIYQYTEKQRVEYHEPIKTTPNETKNTINEATWGTSPTLPLPPVPQLIREGDWYVVAELIFQLSINREQIYWRALVDIETDTVLYLRAMTASINGLVFEYDPVTSTGDPNLKADKGNDVLNPCRTSVPLQNLDQPIERVQHLSGSFVRITDIEPPIIDPPTRPADMDFNYDARTNEFAAVNAYYHNDRFFRLVRGLGFNLYTYFGRDTFPVPVDHRGMGDDQGYTINAHCNGKPGGIDHVCYALSDESNLSQPIGRATDWRCVLHELGGHGTLYNRFNGVGTFGFSHSAGDSFAMILNDYQSKWHITQTIDRFSYDAFATISPLYFRRSDRAVSDGWGWGDTTHDDRGYGSEQILSTTLFRAYRSIGGDSADVWRRRFAAHAMTYLMLRAVFHLSEVDRASHASKYLDALLTADLEKWTSTLEGVYYGGAYGKVLTWAFEKQNLNGGAVPEVDVYIDDGRAGEYLPYLPVFWKTTSVWNRRNPDGLFGHQEPIIGQTNYAYVKIKNRGSSVATNTVVRGYHCKPSAGTLWHEDWKPMTTPAFIVGELQPNNLEEKIVGPFEWSPNENAWGHDCMLMIVSDTRDPSNVSKLTPEGYFEDWRLVPNDNNVAQRNVSLVAGVGGIAGLHGKGFWVRNTLQDAALVVINVKLPEWLQKLGWKIKLRDLSDNGVIMKSFEQRKVIFDVVAGKSFTSDDVKRADICDIDVIATANGAILGGVSYTIDPDITFPANEPSTDASDGADKCNKNVLFINNLTICNSGNLFIMDNSGMTNSNITINANNCTTDHPPHPHQRHHNHFHNCCHRHHHHNHRHHTDSTPSEPPTSSTVTTTLVTLKDSVTIYLTGSGTTVVDWGDGNSDSYDLSPNICLCTHDYANSGSHTITLTDANITFIKCSENQLTTLKVKDNPLLQRLICSDNLLTELDISGLANLRQLNCDINELMSLNVRDFANLVELICTHNNLESLDVTGCYNLSTLGCGYNKLVELIGVNGLENLKTLNCTDNELTMLNVEQCSALTTLRCVRNKLVQLGVRNLDKLYTLDCPSNLLESLDVTNCAALRYLSCSANNQMTSLIGVKNLANLKALMCHATKLTSLDVSNCSALETLSCYANKLESLNVYGCVALKTLLCSDNLLTSLTASGLDALETLDCGYNPLAAVALNDLFTLLPQVSATSAVVHTVNIRVTPGKDTCDTTIATNKNWQVNTT
ncbi:MAG: hypothetical protein FWC33_04690 [Candidatus Bathyarchaeota archaeon]|nr:hypothetical protein [Candidatus Termiticorpusculum sp.]